MEEEAMGRIVVFGAGGKAGKMITDEAAQRGHSVTATVRDLSNVPAFAEGVNEITGDPTDIVSVRALAEDEDVFIVAVGGADNTVWLRAAQTLIETREAIPGQVPRILHMGGSSTLLTAQGSIASICRISPKLIAVPPWGKRRRWTITAVIPTGGFPGHTFLRRRSISHLVNGPASIASGWTIPLKMRLGDRAYPMRILPSPWLTRWCREGSSTRDSRSAIDGGTHEFGRAAPEDRSTYPGQQARSHH